MLRELHISNLAVIADARIDFAPGLNCFTGTTGAGKSLVIGAIEVLLGLRSPADMLRPGVDEGRVTGVFDIRDDKTLLQLETATDLPLRADGGELLLTRRLFSSGRTSVSLNGNPITLAMLKQVAEQLIDVHGQHDHEFLLKPSNQLLVLDDSAELAAVREKYHSAWTELRTAQQRIDDLLAGRELRGQQLELYRFQAGEIDNVQLQPGEFEELSSRALVLANLEKLKKDAAGVQAALYDSEGAALERLKMMSAVLGELSEIDQGVSPIAKSVREATLQLEDAAFDLARYIDRLDLDPAELAEVNDRLNVIHRLVNKYGGTPAGVLEYRDQIAQKIAELERHSDDLSALEATVTPLRASVDRMARGLATSRAAAAKRLGPLIEQQLTELGMDKARFRIEVQTDPSQPGPTGTDTVEFFAQTNPGLPAQPLRKIASGGELSRIMLALKGVVAAGGRVSVLVFDEIDANVGGRLGAVIGGKLRDLARRHQVLCITHLPQIAAYADRHLTVRKSADAGKTQTTVRIMDGPERLEEIAEMIGGQRITDTTRAQARELLEAASPPPPKRKPAKSSARLKAT